MSKSVRKVENDDSASLALKQHMSEAVNTRFYMSHPDIGSVLTNTDNKKAASHQQEIKTGGSEMLAWMDPSDPLESMLMNQMLICQEWMSHCLANASVYSHSRVPHEADLSLKYMSAGRKFMTLYAKQMEILEKRRTQGATAKVNVNNGGQAIVGNVTINKEK